MINKIQKERRKVATMIMVFSWLLLLPIIISTRTEWIFIFPVFLLIVCSILALVLYFRGIVAASKFLTYMTVFGLSVLIGVWLTLNASLPAFIDQSAITGLAVMINLAFTMWFPLHVRVGNMVLKKLDPSLVPTQKYHQTEKRTKDNPYPHLFYNRNSNIVYNKSYAYEHVSSLQQKIRMVTLILSLIVGVLMLLAFAYVDTTFLNIEESVVILGVFLAFTLMIVGISVLMIGFIRSMITGLVCGLVYGIGYVIVIGMEWVYNKSLLLFVASLIAIILFIIYLFALYIKHVEIVFTRSFLVNDEPQKTIAYDPLVHHDIPLVQFSTFGRFTIPFGVDIKSKRTVKMTDKIRYFCIQRKILFVGYVYDKVLRNIDFYFYTNDERKYEKLEAFMKRSISKGTEFSIEIDIENKHYQDELYPEPMRLIEILNEDFMSRLALGKFDFSRSYPLHFFCHIKDLDSRNSFIEVAQQMGYGELEVYQDEYLVLKRELVLEIHQLNQICKKFQQLAIQYGGSFEGWRFA